MSRDAADSESSADLASGKLIACLDGLQECSDLSPREKETVISFSRDDPVARVYTEYKPAMLRLLLHPEFQVSDLRVCGPADEHPPFGETVEPIAYDDGAVTGVRGIIPVGCLTIKQSSRSTKPKANVVSPGVLNNDPRSEDDD